MRFLRVRCFPGVVPKRQGQVAPDDIETGIRWRQVRRQVWGGEFRGLAGDSVPPAPSRQPPPVPQPVAARVQLLDRTQPTTYYIR